MKILITSSRVLLGLVLKVFGLNGFLHLLPSATGFVGRLIAPLYRSYYLPPVFAVASIAGTLLLINRHVPLAVTLLSPVVLNIVLLHLASASKSLPIALLVALLWLATAFSVRVGLRELFTKSWKRISGSRSASDILLESKMANAR